MSEAAFLCMDLEYHEKRDFVYRFLNGYLKPPGITKGYGYFATT